MKDNNLAGIKSFFTQGLSLRLLLMLFDIVAVNVSYLATLILRYLVDYHLTDKALTYVNAFWQFAPYYTAFCLIVFVCFRLYNGMWKYAGMHDLNRIVLANLVTAVGYVAGTILFTKRMTISYYVIGAALQMMLVVLIRFFPRIIVVLANQVKNRKSQVNTLIVGIGEASHLARTHIESDPDNMMKPVCYLTTHDYDVTGTIDGLPVMTHAENLSEYVSKYGIKSVIIADPILPSSIRKDIKSFCKSHSINLQDYSSYFQSGGDATLLSSILEYADGEVEIAIGAVTQSFENGEEALSALEGQYDICSLSGGEKKLIVRLTKHKEQAKESMGCDGDKG